jgi:hypothetical protein
VQARYNDLFSSYRILLNFLGGSIIYEIVVAVGLVLVVAPGIYFALRHQFYDYLIVDKGIRPVEAVKRSGVLTEGVTWCCSG